MDPDPSETPPGVPGKGDDATCVDRIDMVDSIEEVGTYSSLALDRAGGAHVSYHDNTNGDLKYAYHPRGGTWTVSTIDPIDDTGYTTSLKVDKDGGVHVAYVSSADGSGRGRPAYLFKPAGGTWTPRTQFARDASTNGRVSLDVDHDGGVHLAFDDDVQYGISYAYKPADGTWSEPASIANVPGLRDSSLAVDESGGAHIAFGAGDLLHAYKPAGGTWSFEVIDGAGGRFTSVAVTPSGELHVAECVERFYS